MQPLLPGFFRVSEDYVHRVAEPPKPGEPERKIIVRKKVDLEGKHLVRAGVSFEAKGWLVNLSHPALNALYPPQRRIILPPRWEP